MNTPGVLMHDIPAVFRTSLPPALPRGTGEHVARLTRWFESHFDCRDGLPRSWTFHPFDAALLARWNDLEAREGTDTITHEEAKELTAMSIGAERVSYRMFGFTCAGGPEHEKALCDALQKEFEELIKGWDAARAILYWRRKPEMDYAPESHVDFDTPEGRSRYTPARARITMRCAIPAFNMSKLSSHFGDGMYVPVITP